LTHTAIKLQLESASPVAASIQPWSENP